MLNFIARTALSIGLAFACWTLTQARIFTPHQLAQELKTLRVSEWEIPTLVCVAHNASGLNTNHSSVLRMENIRQTMAYYGIFGFPSEWLKRCDLQHEQILDDDLHNDVNCLLMFLQTSNRKEALHHLTPGEVDLDKCLDWWDQLSPSMGFKQDSLTAANYPAETSGSLLTASVLILDAIFGYMAYLVYQLIQVQKRYSSDTISNYPLV